MKILRILNNPDGSQEIPRTNIQALSVEVLRDWANLMGDKDPNRIKSSLLDYITNSYDFILTQAKNEGTKTETSLDTELTISKVQANKNELRDSIA